ncbi:Histidine kinase 2 [Acorus calamus]|uniref:histidine kinase n=1 Tax=Acorus calamus TaxID=4465 RepID=A0AAV9D3H2_ACOCL|nr:Histidine kinase 2 [Acorus calamus]
MSFSAIISSVFAKLPRFFLRIHKWFFARMTLNSKVSDRNNNEGFTDVLRVGKGSCGHRKSWRVVVLCLLFSVIGIVWFSLETTYGGLMCKVRVTHALEEDCPAMDEQFNISKKQLHILASLISSSDQRIFTECMQRSALKRPLSNGLTYAWGLLHSGGRHDEEKTNLVKDSLESQGQCLAQGDHIPQAIRSSVGDESFPFLFSQNSMSNNIADDMTSQEESPTVPNPGEPCHCKHESLDSLKICCWVFVGIIIGRISSSFNRLSTDSKKQVKQQKQSKQPQHHQSHCSKGGWKWRCFPILWVVTGILFSSWLFWIMNDNVVLRRKEMLANMCDERARMLQDQFNMSMNHVNALAILVSTFHHGKHPSAIDQKTFAEYTARTAFERPLTSGVAYALRVLHSEREQFENQHGWRIKKMEMEDQSPVQDEYMHENLDISPVQDEYAPVIFSQETVSHIVSIDMMSGKEDRENILRARASGKGVLTSPFKLLKSNRLGVVLTFAVYNIDLPPNATPEQRINATKGYLGASFDVPSLVEKLLQQLASKQTIVVNVYDTTNASAPINMYGPNLTENGLSHVSNLDFGDPNRKHEMHCRFKQKSPIHWSAITTSSGVLVIILLVGHIFYAAVNRIAKVEDDYREMRELKVRAEAADIAKSRFLATVSHEIRTPMNGVLGMLQMLMDTDLDATQQDYAMTAQASGKSLIALINEVLDQAKIESGRLELEAVPFDPRSILDNVLSLFSGKSQDKGVELAGYTSDQVPDVLIGDPGRFRQIITNLVGNSVKFTEEGHIFVSVYLAEGMKGSTDAELPVNNMGTSYNTLSGFPVVDKKKSWKSFRFFNAETSHEATDTINLLVTVEDTGVGIPKDAQSRIFMPFMQADSSTSRTHGGTGIGLSISKCLVDLMSGEIGFISEPKIGSTFSFTAVFRERQTNLQDMKRQPEPVVLDFRGMRGLVIDGRSARAEVTKYHLQRLGVHVDIAISQKAAFSYISACDSSATEHLNMVLVDKDAWGKGMGVAFLHRLKELSQNHTSKIEQFPKVFLLATSISPTEVNELELARLVDNVMMKPLRLSMISACLQKALGVGTKKSLERRQPSMLKSLLNGKQMLVVDDNSVNRRVAAGALKKYGAIVTCADSGKAAVEMLHPPHKFDACFMDVQMPEMDGFEATRQIRCMEAEVNEQIKSGKASEEMYENVDHWHIPILAMTADVIQATHEECLRFGMDDYVSKPFEEEQLYSAVAHFFESDKGESTY